MSVRFKLIYSETSRKQIKSLHPTLKPPIKSKIEQIRENPYAGKFLIRDLSGYLSLRVNRYRIIYKINAEKRRVEIHYVGHRKDIYERFNEQMKSTR